MAFFDPAAGLPGFRGRVEVARFVAYAIPALEDVAAPPKTASVKTTTHIIDDRALEVKHPNPNGLGAKVSLAGVDITPYVHAITIRLGMQSPRRMGAAAPPSTAEIVLRDDEQLFNILNPNENIDVLPGAHVDITLDNPTTAQLAAYLRANNLDVDDADYYSLFRGYSSGVRTADIGPERVSQLGARGVIGHIAETGLGVYKDLNQDVHGNLPAALIAILNDGGYDEYEGRHPLRFNGVDKESYQRLDYAPEIIANRLQRIAGVMANRRRGNVFDALQTIALAEGGIIHDDSAGKVHFNSGFGVGYSSSVGVGEVHIPTHEVDRLTPLDPTALIVNELNGESDDFRSAGEQGITDFGDYQLPMDIPIPPDADNGGAYSIILRPSDISSGRWAFIQSWVGLVRGTHYTYTLSNVPPLVETYADRIEIHMRNETQSEQTLRLIKIDAEPFKGTGAVKLGLINRESIRRYGRKRLSVPYELFRNRDIARQRFETLMERYTGIDRNTGVPRPLQAFKVNLPGWHWANGRFDVGQLVTLDYSTPQKTIFQGKACWVVGVEYRFDTAFNADIELTLLGVDGQPVERIRGVGSGRVFVCRLSAPPRLGRVTVARLAAPYVGDAPVIPETPAPAGIKLGEVKMPLGTFAWPFG